MKNNLKNQEFKPPLKRFLNQELAKNEKLDPKNRKKHLDQMGANFVQVMVMVMVMVMVIVMMAMMMIILMLLLMMMLMMLIDAD